jgi:DNA topoisomerase IA
MYRGDLVVECLDLSFETPEITEAPVKRTLGQTDMYWDTAKPHTEQHLVEDMLSKIETAELGTPSTKASMPSVLHAASAISSENFFSL